MCFLERDFWPSRAISGVAAGEGNECIRAFGHVKCCLCYCLAIEITCDRVEQHRKR